MHHLKKTAKASSQEVLKNSSVLRSLLAATLSVSGAWQILPSLASAQSAPLTPAGTPISNTATGTYQDPNNPNTTLNTTSNTVTVAVAEIAGITLAASGVPIDITTPATGITVGDTVTYTFTLTNVGNDSTTFRIPNQATTTGPGSVSGNLEYSYNGINWYEIDGNLTPVPVGAPSGFPGSETASQYITGPVGVGGTVQVRVKVLVTAGAVNGNVITVQLGNTTGSAGSQNVALINNGGDVYTVDNADGSVGALAALSPSQLEIAGAPVNGDREASDTQSSTVSTANKNLALATLLKTRVAYTGSLTAPFLTQPVVYNLSLKVEGTDVTGQGITPQPLAGYAGISVNGLTATNYILISDVLPTGTVLTSAPTATDTTWTAVYSTDNTSTPNAALWTTTQPALSTVKRVGFIKSTGTTAAPILGNYIPAGSTVSGFAIPVAISPEPAPGQFTISNIAQLVGQTPTVTLGVLEPSVYDESGDQNPANYSGVPNSMTPGSTDANNDGVPDNGVGNNTSTGVADPANQGIDTGNNNTGTGPGGEVNVLTLGAAPAVLNGPLNAPAATGPDGTTATDFTNKSSLIADGVAPGSTIDPAAVAFGNTVQNNSGAIATVTLVPTVPSNALDLPNGTTVTITYLAQTATFTYVQGGGGSFTGTAIQITGVAAGASISYGVEVNLPSGTKLSTDITPDYVGDTEWGYPVPITATINSVSNITIDRVFTGYLRLLKVSRVLQGTGPDVATADLGFSIAPKKAAPGNIIEYQIQYTNISSGQSGSGSVILNADRVIITEDGTVGANNWALVNPAIGGVIFTSNVVAPGAVDSNNGAITFFPAGNQSGTTQAADVTKYVNTLPTMLAPQGSGTFTFQRKVNQKFSSFVLEIPLAPLKRKNILPTF